MNEKIENGFKVMEGLVEEYAGMLHRAGHPLGADALRLQGKSTIEEIRAHVAKVERSAELEAKRNEVVEDGGAGPLDELDED